MRLALLFLAGCAGALAQLDNDTITVTAQIAGAPQPDQVSIEVCLAAEVGTGLAEALAPLSPLGIDERSVVEVTDWPQAYCPYPEPTGKLYLWWRFASSAPLAKMKATVAALKRVSAGLPEGWAVAYSVNSQWKDQRECATPTLVSQARRHAESIAAAAALRIGPVLALSNNVNDVQVDMGVPAAMVLSPQLSMITTARPTAAACLAVVQFKLLR